MNIKTSLIIFILIFCFALFNGRVFAQNYTYSISGGGTSDVNGVYVNAGTYTDNGAGGDNTTNDYYVKVSGNSTVMTIYYYQKFWTILPSISNQSNWEYYWDGTQTHPTMPLGGDPTGNLTAWLGVSNGGNGVSPYPVSSQNTISNITFADGSAYTPSPKTPGTTDNAIGRFELTGSSVGGVLQGLTISLSGTRSGVSNIKLWSSSSSSFNTSTATLLETISTDNSSISFSGFNSLVDNSSGTYYFITVDLAAGATGNVKALIPSQSSFSFAGANQPSSFSNAALSSGIVPLPVELNTFSAVDNGNSVELIWTTATEVNNYGFEVERSLTPIPSQTLSTGRQEEGISGTFLWKDIGFVKGNGNSNSPKNYSFVDNNPLSSTVEYRLKQIDNNGQFVYSKIVEVTSLPTQFSLEQNYPNPFNPTTTIQYAIPKAEHVTLKVYDEIGRVVASLVDENKVAGQYRVQFNGSRLASGIYYYRINAGSFNDVKKLLLLK